MLNSRLKKLPKSYLFPEIEKRVAAHPGPLINLGIGDTTHPLPEPITEAMSRYAKGLSQTHQGYGPSAGWLSLREAIAKRFYTNISPDEIFISDGAKPDLARLLYLFEPGLTISVQDPAYPVYVEQSLLAGHTLTKGPADITYICSPNNPTGHVSTQRELARLTNTLVIFDAAYSAYIQDKTLPTTIFDLPQIRAIETNSFSKLAGFTGIRLGWTVVPKSSGFHAAYHRLTNTLFNGASNIAQAGALAALSDEGWPLVQEQIAHIMENARLLKQALPTATGGENAPYLWLKTPDTSWYAFDRLLQLGIITVPGSGFGAAGEYHLRLSAFAPRDQILSACEKLIRPFATAFS